MPKFKETNALEKIIPSIINVLIAFILSSPFLLIDKFGNIWKIAFVLSFYFYNLFFLLFNKNRCLGMILMKTFWKEEYSFWKKFIYINLYTLSFSTIIFWIFFPFDLLIFNLLFLQLPIVLWKKTTLHGFLSGNMVTVKMS